MSGPVNPTPTTLGSQLTGCTLSQRTVRPWSPRSAAPVPASIRGSNWGVVCPQDARAMDAKARPAVAHLGLEGFRHRPAAP